MSDNWFYVCNQQRLGPVPFAHLKQLASVGQLLGGDLVWTEGMDNWQAAGTIPGLIPPQPPGTVQPAQPFNAQYAQPYPQQYAPNPNTYYQPMQYAGVEPSGQSYQGFAIAGFVLSFFGILALLGLIFSIVALSGMKRSGNESGKGLAVAGLVISIVVLGLFALYLIGLASCCGAGMFR